MKSATFCKCFLFFSLVSFWRDFGFSGNQGNGGSFQEELKKSISEIDKSWNLKYSLIETYFRFIECHCDFDNDVALIIEATDKQYRDLLIKEFPKELPMTLDVLNTFMERIKERQKEMYNDAMDAWHKSEVGGVWYNDRDSDWRQSYDDETAKWDKETDGSWRTENDFG